MQVKEEYRLVNKLRKQHICFLKQKMKMKSATQLHSKSKEDALTFCKNVLPLKKEDFAGCNCKPYSNI